MDTLIPFKIRAAYIPDNATPCRVMIPNPKRKGNLDATPFLIGSQFKCKLIFHEASSF